MILDRWRARRAILTRSAPSPLRGPPDPRLFELVDALREPLAATNALGDPIWHARWEGDLQLVGLDATTRAVGDVRQRLTRLVHEMDLRHVGRGARRVVAVLLVEPREGEGLQGWLARLADDQGEVGEAWKHVRGRLLVLAVDVAGEHRMSGGDDALRGAIEAALG